MARSKNHVSNPYIDTRSAGGPWRVTVKVGAFVTKQGFAKEEDAKAFAKRAKRNPRKALRVLCADGGTT